MLHRLWAGALVASLGVVASSAPSWAEPTWLPTVEVSSGAPVLNGHDVAHLPDGTTVVVWAEEVEHEERVFFATRGLGEGAQRLRSGTYRVRLTATDPAGNTSATVTIRFRVDRG